MIKKINLLPVILLLLIPFCSFSQSVNLPELKKMYDEDQGARKVAKIDWKKLNHEDSLRQQRVYELLKDKQVNTGTDYYHAAMIFQHGNDTVASGMAVKLMKTAIELDSTVNRWLLAAAIDRDLMRKNQPQIYGTQYIKTSANAPWVLYKIDTTQVTDAERKYYRVETLAEQRLKERKMNQLQIGAYYEEVKSVDQVITLIKQEKKKGTAAAYSVDEASINNFGYQLLGTGETEKALKIFKLNTELYPKGFNTFDSYGECLLKAGRKKAAVAAYQKSLKLNPENQNAREVLKKLSE